MLEYLFDILQKNIIFIFFCVLGLAIASAFSKKVKIVFVGLIVLSASYFALLCLYRLGIGIDSLYYESCKIVIAVCEGFEQYHFLFFNSEIFFRLIKITSLTSLNDILYHIEIITIGVICLLFFFDLYFPFIFNFKIRNVEIQYNYVMKQTYYTNNIVEKQPRFILNSILRC